MLDQRISVKTLLRDVEKVLAQPPVTASAWECPHSTQILTPREREILSTLVRIKRAKQVAMLMHLSPKTVMPTSAAPCASWALPATSTCTNGYSVAVWTMK